jgi:hypothetical protein
MGSEMNAIKTELCVCTADGNNPTTLPPHDSNARGNSTEFTETNISETAMPNHDVLTKCNSSAHGDASGASSANMNQPTAIYCLHKFLYFFE